jgi:hypothetical protein
MDDAERNDYDQLVGDPFNQQPPAPHPALSDHHDLAFDIYDGLFDYFFESDEYCHWSSGQKLWQLHCCGGPGSGKVWARYSYVHPFSSMR